MFVMYRCIKYFRWNYRPKYQYRYRQQRNFLHITKPTSINFNPLWQTC